MLKSINISGRRAQSRYFEIYASIRHQDLNYKNNNKFEDTCFLFNKMLLETKKTTILTIASLTKINRTLISFFQKTKMFDLNIRFALCSTARMHWRHVSLQCTVVSLSTVVDPCILDYKMCQNWVICHMRFVFICTPEYRWGILSSNLSQGIHFLFKIFNKITSNL